MLSKKRLKWALKISMSPSHKRQLIVEMVNWGRYTARKARRDFGLHRSLLEAKQPMPRWQSYR